MQKTTTVVFASIALALLTAPGLMPVAHAQTGLYGIGGFGTGNAETLYRINEATGAATAIGSTGLVGVIDLAFDPSSDALVALTTGGDRYAVNPTTAQATLIADVVDFIPEGGLAFSSGGAAYTTNFDDLHVAMGNGAFSMVGMSGLSSAWDVSGLAFANNRLFGFASNGTDADALVWFDTTTGAGTVIGTNGVTMSDALGGLAWNFAGSDLFATDGQGLYRMSTLDGSASLVGALGVSDVSGIAYIPGPGAVGALVGGLALARRRRAH